MEDHVPGTDTTTTIKQSEFSALTPNFAEEILQKDTLVTSLISVQQLSEDQTSETCNCIFDCVGANCLESTIFSWQPDYPLICGNCFFNRTDKPNHECILEKSELEKVAKDVLLDSDVIIQLFEIYCVEHDILFFSELLKNFERGLRALIKDKISELLIMLIKKDRSANEYFNSG
jgi:hypothetical protein